MPGPHDREVPASVGPELPHRQSSKPARSSPSRKASTRRPIDRLYSAQHLDDHSVYHGGYHDDHDEGESDYEEDDMESLKSVEGEGLNEVRDGIADEKDLEALPISRKSTTKSKKDPNIVTWDGPDDPQNPKNWKLRSKWAATLVISSFTFISPVSSSMVAPALVNISSDLNITNQVESQIVLSIFILAYAIGPLFLGPLSEIYGRVPVLQLANLFYLVFNLACGFAQNKAEMIVFRFLSGLGGSAPLSVGGGALGDCWRADERGRAIAVYSLAPLLGPSLGPLAGGFITKKTTWRWTFYATAIADAVIQVTGLFLLRETYPPTLLQRKARKLRKESGNSALRTEFDHPERSLANTMKRSLIRPFKLLGTQPIVQVLAVYMAYLYGLMYLVLSTFPPLWTDHYHENVGIGGLNYISLGVGFFLGSQVCAPLNDRIYRWFRARNNGEGKPEFRVPIMNAGSILVPVGLFIYGWTAQYKVHWIGPNIGAAVFAMGMIIGFQCIQTYLVDAYTRYAASAVAASTVLRSLAGFGFPLFAPYMYAKLDYGWGNSLLGFIAIALGIPAPLLLWNLGQKLRERSKFAAGGYD